MYSSNCNYMQSGKQCGSCSEKPADLDLHCFKKHGISGDSVVRVRCTNAHKKGLSERIHLATNAKIRLLIGIQ